MSALAKVTETGRVFYPIRVAVRNGEIVRVKRCAACGQDKTVADDETSEFPINLRRHGRVVSWKPECKPCFAARVKRRRLADPEMYNARRRARYAAQPEEWRRRRAERAHRWREEKLREDPTYFRDELRMRQVLRRTEAGADTHPRRLRDVSAGRPREDAAAFRSWLTAYKRAMGNPGNTELAATLGIQRTRVRRVLAEKQLLISLDVVDTALLNSSIAVWVNGRAIYVLSDLYPPRT